MGWEDLFRIFNNTFEDDPQTKKTKSRDDRGAGISQPDVVPMVRQDGGNMWSSGKGMIRLGQDFVDFSSVTGRNLRIKEYDRLRNLPEIEQAMTVIADEACVAEDTLVQTLFDGLKTIKWLTENKKEDFFVYCWDFDKDDYTIGIASKPRFIKKEQTVKVLLNDGTSFQVTRDHLMLLANSAWVMGCQIKTGDELMPFFRIPANQNLNNNNKKNQFPRIHTKNKGWVHERQFIDEWRLGRSLERYEGLNKACRMIESGLNQPDIGLHMGKTWDTVEYWFTRDGLSYKEVKHLCKNLNNKRVIGVIDGGEVDVYDLSVKDYKNFCGESVIFHNCQKDSEVSVVKITCKNQDVVDELNWLFLDREMLNLNRKLWGYTKRACINGDVFLELVIDPDNPKSGVAKIKELPPDTMYRIESTMGKLFEFQQGAEGPDYEALLRPLEETTDKELQQAKAIRFTPEQIVHIRVGEDRRNFYPYGVSLLEPARGPAQQLRLMEDAMVIYRLTRAPERRVFYIDVGNMPAFRADQFMTRVKDLLRKRKVVRPGGDTGANSVEEKYAAPTADEDFWIPTRPNSNTRVETLPGAQNLGEIDDTVYFRNKLYVALNMPANYFSSDDVGSTRMTLSVQNVRFARMIERIQEYMEDGLYEIALRHLTLLGYPTEAWDGLKIKITISSEYKELGRMEIDNNRINNANALKGSMLFSDWDILTRIMKVSESEAEEMIARMEDQKIREARLQIAVQNPGILGIGTPGEGENQMGTEPGGPSPMMAPDGAQPPPAGGPDQSAGVFQKDNLDKINTNIVDLPDASDEEIKKYDLEILSYGQEMDYDEPDYSALD
jgi:hypothetical protein